MRASLRSPQKSYTKTEQPGSPGFQGNLEESKKLLYSALVLKARDRLAALEAASNQSQTDQFWSQLDSLLARHETHMTKIAQKASSLRTSLSNSRLQSNSMHKNRMAKAQAELERIQEQIKECEEKIANDQTESYKQTENSLFESIEDANREISELNARVSSLRKITNDLKTKLQTSTARLELQQDKLKKKREDAEAESKRVNDEIESLNRQIKEADATLAELENHENLAASILSSFQQPISSIDRLFPQ